MDWKLILVLWGSKYVIATTSIGILQNLNQEHDIQDKPYV